MKALLRKTYRSAYQSEVEEYSKPTPKKNQLLIKVKATTVNRTDCAIFSGVPFVMRFFTGLIKPKMPIPGTDFAGEVVEIGAAVKQFEIGDKVFGFNDDGIASQAEYMCISEKGNVVIIPEAISYKQAAASIEGVHYAINFLNKLKIQNNAKVLINGTTGAIGSAMLQLIKQYENIHITAVCNTKNIDLIKSFKPNEIIDYTKCDFTTQDKKYDYILDAVGKSCYRKCKNVLNSRGIYLSTELGESIENLYLPITTKLRKGSKVIFPFPSNIKRSLHKVQEMLSKRVFIPVIEKEFNFENILEAYKYVQTGQKTGNVVVIMHAD